MNTSVEITFLPSSLSKKMSRHFFLFVGFICALRLVTAVPLGWPYIGIACVFDVIIILGGWRLARFFRQEQELKRLVMNDQGLRYASRRGEIFVTWDRITGVDYAGPSVRLSVGPDRFLRLAGFENMDALQDWIRRRGLPADTDKRLSRMGAIWLSIFAALITAVICVWVIADAPESFEYLWISAIALLVLSMRKPWSLHLGEHPVRAILWSFSWPSIGLVIISVLAYLYLHQASYK